MSLQKSLYINFKDTWEANKLKCSGRNCADSKDSQYLYCLLIEQYKLESYKFYKQNLLMKRAGVIYIWRPGLW